MTAAQRDQVIGTWQGSAVDVARIEAVLAGLWKDAGQREAASGGQAPARTSVLNLVVYVSNQDDAQQAARTMATLSGRHPSRTICVVADPHAPTSSLDATVTGQATTIDPTHGRLCWEHIDITAHGTTARHAPSIVIPLLLHDLPTYVWWTGDAPFGSALFQRMTDLCDRLIVDSGYFERPIDGLVKLAALTHERGEDRGAGDFHWMRLTPWRNLIAQFFDAEELRPYAYRIETVQLGYAQSKDHGGMAQALLLAGWLASRLAWTPRPHMARLDGDRLRIEAQRADQAVAIEIEPRRSAGADHGDLVSVAMTATLRDVPAIFSVERQAEESLATTSATIGAAASAAHTVRMTTRSAGELLCEELEVYRHDRIYEAALACSAALCQRIATEEQ